MRFSRVLEPADALVHVPAERADHADVVVVPHVAVGDDVQPGFFLIADHRRHRIVVSLFMLDFLKRDANIAAKQLVAVPLWSWKGTDHCGRQKCVDNFSWHFEYSLK